MKDFPFQVESFAVRVASFALRVEDFTVRVTSFGLWAEDFTFRMASSALSAPGFSDRVQDFIVWVESLVFRVEALRSFAQKVDQGISDVTEPRAVASGIRNHAWLFRSIGSVILNSCLKWRLDPARYRSRFCT
jgi:hypothetical protein